MKILRKTEDFFLSLRFIFLLNLLMYQQDIPVVFSY
jgi:hypothetical protein